MKLLEKKKIKNNLKKTIAIVEKDIKLEFRFKGQIVLRVFNPIITLVLFLIIFGTLFNITEGYQLGYWNSQNYSLFILLGFCVTLLRSLINKYNITFIREKFWRTLQGLLVAPLNKFNLLVGVILTELVLNLIPLTIVLIIIYFFFPIPIQVLFLIFLVFLAISLTFGSIGLFIGVFSIANEDVSKYLLLFIRIIFAFTCINYPLQIFPNIIQYAILFNPLYYYIDLLRILWNFGIDPSVAIYLAPQHIIVVVIFTTITPIISVYFFNRIYKKFGITGY